MQKVTIFGCGMIGKTIADDLSKDFKVTSVDRDTAALAEVHESAGVETETADFADTARLAELVGDQDLVVGAVPGFLGYRVLETVIRAGKPVVDISFFPEDPFGLDTLAKERQVPAIVDCGVAPGLCNLVAGRWNERMELSGYECLVGGLPLEPEPPFRYKAPFSPVDVIEEYTRPARIRVGGEALTRDALSEVESVDIPPRGRLEAFLTDGLRTLLTTLPGVRDMKEKTLRYPGHADAMRALRDAGLFGTEKVTLPECTIAPITLTSGLLFDRWKYGPGEADFTAMRIRLTGRENEATARYELTLYDEMDRATGTRSMARTTGYTCAAAVRLLAQGRYRTPGIAPPEYIGADEACYDFILQELSKRNVRLSVRKA